MTLGSNWSNAGSSIPNSDFSSRNDSKLWQIFGSGAGGLEEAFKKEDKQLHIYSKLCQDMSHHCAKYHISIHGWNPTPSYTSPRGVSYLPVSLKVGIYTTLQAVHDFQSSAVSTILTWHQLWFKKLPGNRCQSHWAKATVPGILNPRGCMKVVHVRNCFHASDWWSPGGSDVVCSMSLRT